MLCRYTCTRYYYNQWMKQRIHLSLLELHLAAADNTRQQHHQQQLLGAAPSSNSNTPANTDTSTSSARGRLLLSLLADGAADAPAVAAAAVAAGFQCPATAPALTLTSASTPATSTPEPAAPASLANPASNGSGSSLQRLARPSEQGSAAASLSGHLKPQLQLPEPVVSKLLSLDAGDLDLLVQHPVALQGQVFELLDVLQVWQGMRPCRMRGQWWGTTTA